MRTATNPQTGERFYLDEKANEWKPLKPPPFGGGILGQAAELAGGFNKGVTGLLDLPSKLATIPMRAMGANVSTEPFTDLARMAGAVPTPEQETNLSRFAEPAGGALIPFAGMHAAAARTAPQAASGLIRSIQTNPGAFNAAELASTAGAGAGSVIGHELGGDTGQAIGGLVGALGPAAVTGATRLGLRGSGPAGRRAMTENVQQARDVGVELTAGQAGSPTAAALENTLGRMPGGVGRQVRRAQETAESLQSAVGKLSGPPVNDTNLGQWIRRGIEGPGGYLQRWGDRVDGLYTKLGQEIGPESPVLVKKSLDTLTELSKPIQGAENISALLQNPKVGRYLEAFTKDAANGVIPYDALKRIRSQIGRVIGSPALHEGEPIAELRRLYAAMSDDLEAAARAKGPQALAAFNRANNAYKRGVSFLDEKLAPIVGKRYPEQIVSAFESSVKKGSSMVRDMKRALTPEQFDVVRRSTIGKLGEATASAQDDLGGRFSIETFVTNWNKLAPEAKNALFGAANTASRYRRDLDRIASVAARVKDSQRVLSNRSGTSGALANIAIASVPGGAAGYAVSQASPEILLGALMSAGGVVGSSAGTQALMQSPAFVNWLTRATRVPVTQIPARIGELNKLIESTGDPVLSDAMTEYRNAIQ